MESIALRQPGAEFAPRAMPGAPAAGAPGRFGRRQGAVGLADQLSERRVGQILAGSLPNGERLPSESRRAGFSASAARRRRGGGLRLAPIGGIAGLMRCDELGVALAGETSYLAAQRRTVAANASNDQQQERKYV